MKARLHAERLAPARRVREILANDAPVSPRRPRAEAELAAWLETQQTRRREAYGFREMGRKLDRQAREMKRERYVTSMLGVKTSWARIEEYGKYFVFGSRKSNGGRRAERPERGGNWVFNPRDGQRVAA